MKILVIGGTNFIGPTVVHQLCAMGHEVTVLNRGRTQAELPPEVNYIRGDRHRLAEMKSEFERLAPQVVLDMILYTEPDALRLMNTFREIAQRLVVVSSMDVYRAYDVFWGRESEIVPVPLTEDSPLRQQLYPYREMPSRPIKVPADYEKILVERVVMADPDLPGTIVRLPMVYGPRDPLHRLDPFLQRMDERRPVILLEESIARWRGSYGYVENVAAAIALAATNDLATGRTYHVAEPAAPSELERISRIGHLAGWQGKVVAVPRDSLPAEWKLGFNTDQHWFIDTTRIRQELGYNEVIPMDEALKRTIDWQRSYPPKEVSLWAVPYLLNYATEDAILTELE